MAPLTAAQRLQRLLAVIPWVAANDGPKVADVCARFGMTPKALVNELEMVSMAGLPPYTGDVLFDVVFDDDRVWITWSPTFERPFRLTPDQALSLVAAGAAWQQVPGADPDGPLARGLDKIATTLGVRMGDDVEVGLEPAVASLLPSLHQAIAKRTSVVLDYYGTGRDTRSERTVDPMRMWNNGGRWYLMAWDHLREDERVFRLDRIVTLTVTDDVFDRRDPVGEVAVFHADPTDPRIRLRLQPSLRWMVETYPCEDVSVDEDGAIEATFTVASDRWLARVLLTAGPDATVVDSPAPELAAAGADAARRILARYRTS